MRVITGSARGRRLKELEGMETRPTTDRVKEGLFNVLQFDIEGRRVLDLFAGTGQLGIECLSRGAASAVFVDKRPDAVKLIRDNLKLCDLTDRARVVAGANAPAAVLFFNVRSAFPRRPLRPSARIPSCCGRCPGQWPRRSGGPP